MDESRRERKKRQTRQLLVATALRLFKEQGYDQTTVAQIAAAADVATKTFFNYFPTKEDVLFSSAEESYGLLIEVIAGRSPGEDIPALLYRTYDLAMSQYRTQDVLHGDQELMEVFGTLVTTVPALQAKALHLGLELQRRIARALLESFPDVLDPVSAAAVVGAFMGAFQGATLAAAELGQPEEDVIKAARRGLDIAMDGLKVFGGSS